MSALILDAWALVAVNRGDRAMIARLRAAQQHGLDLRSNAMALAQVWRDGARQATLSKMLRNPGLVEAPLRHDDAKRIGELLRDSGTSDVVDAHVAVLAAHLRAPVITSDPADISRLNAAVELIDI